jgi:hypothetical protein
MGLLSKPTQGERAFNFSQKESKRGSGHPSDRRCRHGGRCGSTCDIQTVAGLNPTQSDKNRQQAHPARDYRITKSGAGKKQSEGPHIQGRLTTKKENTKWKGRKARPQTRTAPHSTEPTIAQTTRATGQRLPTVDTSPTTKDSHSEATTAKRTEHEAASEVLATTPKEQCLTPEEIMAKADNVPRVPHQGTGTQTLAEGAISPLASGMRDCCSIWICSQSKSVNEA